MQIKLTYIVQLGEGYKISTLENDILVSLSGMQGILAWSRNQKIVNKHLVTFSALDEPNTFQVFLEINAAEIGILDGGMSRLLTIIMGNPFRHQLVQKVRLTKIDFSSDITNHYDGPLWGLDGIKSYFSNIERPLLSTPLPMYLTFDEKTELLKNLIDFGINMICDSPNESFTIEILERNISFLNNLSEKLNKKFFYFINGTVSLDILSNYIKVIKKYDSSNFKMGFRICPFSLGLNVCSYIHDSGIHIFGYNLLHLFHDSGGRFSINPGVIASILRVIGCDLINVGLRARNILSQPIALEIIESTRGTSTKTLKPSYPVFTGTLTPRMTYKVIKQYGADVIIHVKKPILRNGFDNKKLKRNVNALLEAMNLALTDVSINKAMQKENRATKNWRSYENEFDQY